jgi:alpha-amylase
MSMIRILAPILICSLISVSCVERRERDQGKASAIPIGERVFYEIFVHAYYDSNGDGIGDLNGVTAKLDYLKDLGATGIWLLPVHPSPTYHKYDVTDYYSIHPDYGTMEDMKTLLDEAHKRDILVLIDMVINHSSSEHFFFREARKGKDNPYWDYYVWSSDSLVQKREPHHWHTNGKDPEKYYGFFWKGMPDFNFDNPKVREEMKKVGKFWLTEVGVDGFRLDAIKFIYPDSLIQKNVEWWQEYRAALENTGKDFFLVAEIWDDAEFIGPFLDRGVHAAFNFDLSFAIEEMLTEKKDPGLARIVDEIQKDYQKISDSYNDAIFLKNHDQDRIMSLMSDPRQARLAASILFTLPGIPFIYYGEEIGMLGMKPDQYIREPMVWDLPGQDPRQTTWIVPRYSTPGKVTPVMQQMNDSTSLLNHYKKMIALRREYKTLSLGTIRSLEHIPDHFCAYELVDADSEIIVIHNLDDKPAILDNKLLNARGRIIYLSGIYNEDTHSLQLDPFGTLIQYSDHPFNAFIKGRLRHIQFDSHEKT